MTQAAQEKASANTGAISRFLFFLQHRPQYSILAATLVFVLVIMLDYISNGTSSSNRSRTLTSTSLQIPTTASNMIALTTQFTHCTTTTDAVHQKPALDLSGLLLPSTEESLGARRRFRRARKVFDMGEKSVSVHRDDEKPELIKTWISGYPGSGAEIVRTLVETVSGHETDVGHREEGIGCSTNDVISCKSYYPLMPYGNWNEEPAGTTFNNRYILLLRNPANALPSYFNQKWEIQNPGLQVQAPLEDWRMYRDRQVDLELDKWVNVIKAWDSSPYTVALYVPYEEMVQPMTGPALLYEMAREFVAVHKPKHELDDEDEDIHHMLIDKASIPCIWKSKLLDSSEGRRWHGYEPGYTPQQQRRMITTLSNTITWAKGRLVEQSRTVTQTKKPSRISSKKHVAVEHMTDYERLIAILEGYRDDVTMNLVVDDETEPLYPPGGVASRLEEEMSTD